MKVHLNNLKYKDNWLPIDDFCGNIKLYNYKISNKVFNLLMSVNVHKGRVLPIFWKTGQ